MRSRGWILRFSWANLVLLTLAVAQLGTGFAGLINGSEGSSWMLWLHGAGAYGIVFLLAWKGRIVLESISRPWRWRAGLMNSLVLITLLLATLATGLIWVFAGRILIYGYSLITIHIVLAFGVLALLPWHVFGKRWVFRNRNAMSRRTFLRAGGIALGGVALYLLAGRVMDIFALPGAKRRFTGSYETDSYSFDFPIVIWLFDYPAPIDVRQWRLTIDAAVDTPLVLTYDQLAQMAKDAMVGLIDCTGGWYAYQEWEGVGMGALLDMAGMKASARSISFEAVSGYGRRFEVEESRGFLLALRVAGTQLNHPHGYPVRLVAPPHRGFEWVKWLTHIRVNETSRLLQPPVPLQ